MKTKEKVLQILQNNNDCVSGELLANECEVSRAAVWKAVKSLRDDGFLIEATTHDLSLGGISFISDKPFSSIYKKISGILTLELPKNTLINFPDGKMSVETKFVRETLFGNFGETLYSFKFIGVKLEDEEILKNFLLRLN